MNAPVTGVVNVALLAKYVERLRKLGGSIANSVADDIEEIMRTAAPAESPRGERMKERSILRDAWETLTTRDAIVGYVAVGIIVLVIVFAVFAATLVTELSR